MAFIHTSTKYIKIPWDFENFLEFWCTLVLTLACPALDWSRVLTQCADAFDLIFFIWLIDFLLFYIGNHLLMRSLRLEKFPILLFRISTAVDQTNHHAVDTDIMFECSFGGFALGNNQNPSISNHNSWANVHSGCMWWKLVLLVSSQCTNCTTLDIPTKTEANLKRLMIVSFDK